MKKYMMILMPAVLLMGSMVVATPMIGYVETWDSGLGTGGDWLVENVGDGANPTLANAGGTLQLTIANTTVPAARMYAGAGSSGGAFSGDFSSLGSGYGSQLAVQFELASIDNNNSNPGSMSLFFVGNGNLYILNNGFTQPTPSGSLLYTAVINSESAWNNMDSGVFSSDFANVSQFGLQLVGSSDLTTHRYQLDNFQLLLAVPEPETVWMILVVMVSLMITFRARISELIAQVKCRFTA